MDECQNVIAFKDFEEIDDATPTTITTTRAARATTRDCMNMGQSESKKNAKRSKSGSGGPPETKGTAMSFGFKKKLLYSTNASKKTDAKNQLERLQTLAVNEANHRHHQNASSVANASASTTASSNSSTASNALATQSDDDNGNTTITTPNESINESRGATGRTTPRLTPPRKESSGAPYRSIRFGFRQTNSVRPASTDPNPTLTGGGYDNVSNNNVNAKPRSKSAANPSRSNASQQQQPHVNQIKANQSFTPPPPTTTTTTNPIHQSHQNNAVASSAAAARHPKISPVSTTVNISYQSQSRAPTKSAFSAAATSSAPTTNVEMSQRPMGECNNKPPSGKPPHPHQHLYTNDIIRPTPQSASPSVSALVTKFTLHTASLPKPQFPVPITLATPSPIEPTPPTDVMPPVMDTKFAKQTANTNRRGGAAGFRGPRDISNDSGISNMGHYYGGSSVEHSSSYDSPQRRSHSRPRNFEMIMSTRHKFDVRQLDDSLSDESTVVPLSLPKLPSVFSNSGHSQPAPLSGLIRSQQQQQESPAQTDDEANSVTFNFRKSSYASHDVDSTEEEKEFRDKSTSEKNSRPRTVLENKEYSPGSKTSSPLSSRASWGNAGESMAMKDCSSMSVSSCDSMNNKVEKTLSGEDDVDNFSSPLVTTSYGQNFMSPTTSALNDPPVVRSQLFNRTLDEAAVPYKERALLIDIGSKFAQITADVDDMFLDDETSPTDSMVSSTDSDEIISKRNKKKINDAIKEKDIDEFEAATPSLPHDISSPLMSPGSPTHASRSLSLSDECGRDFLIDDEIADQPALCFSKNHDIAASSQHLNSLTDTPTLTGSLSNHSSRPQPQPTNSVHQHAAQNTPYNKNNNKNTYAPQAKPRHSLIARTESLDTLSPCESIASDDMMMDFDSSVDSIDRLCQSMQSDSTSALHSMDGQMLWPELEAQGGKIMGEWSNLLRDNKQNSRDIMISQLPARATRLLNRSRVQHPGGPAGPGSESPRSLDSYNRNKTPNSSRPSPHPHHMLNPSGSPSSHHNQSNTSLHSSDDSIFMLDKSMRNTMIQDVLQFKKELLRLRSILQEPEEECLTRTDTLNPFETSNGQFFGTGVPTSNDTLMESLLMGGCGGDGQSLGANQLDNIKNKELYNLSASHDETRIELADLRRQVVYLQDDLVDEVQSQMDDKDRTIRIQQTLIDKLETEIDRVNMDVGRGDSVTPSIEQVDTTNTATQTERIRPLSMGGQDGASSTCSENEELLPSPPLMKNNTLNTTPPTLKRHQPAVPRLCVQSPLKSSPRSIIPLLNQPNISHRAISPTHKSQSAAPPSPLTSRRSTTSSSSGTGVDFQHSTPKTSPTIGSPRRIPRLVKQPNATGDLPVITSPTTYHNGTPSHIRRTDENVHHQNGDHVRTTSASTQLSQHPSIRNLSQNNAKPIINGDQSHITHPPSTKTTHIHHHNHSNNPNLIQYHTPTLSASNAKDSSSDPPDKNHVLLRNRLNNVLRSPLLRSLAVNDDGFC